MSGAKDIVVEAARKAHKKHWRSGSSVGAQTKRSSNVCKAWQAAVLGSEQSGSQNPRYVAEFNRGVPGHGHRIDLVDMQRRTAYELKSSPNNGHHEFYRDVFKALVINSLCASEQAFDRLVFLAPAEAINRLRRPFAEEAMRIAKENGLEVKLVSLS